MYKITYTILKNYQYPNFHLSKHPELDTNSINSNNQSSIVVGI